MPALYHAAGAGDFVIAFVLVEAVAAQDLVQHESIAGSRGIDRYRLAPEILDPRDLWRGHETEETAVAAHDRGKFGLRPDRRFALALDIGDDVVDRGHRDIELGQREVRHLGDGVRRILDFDRNAGF